MVSSFWTLDTVRRALSAQQKAIHVISHNIANANTPGFSRQVATLTTTPPYTKPSFTHNPEAGQVGTGVEVSSLRRMRDTFLDFHIRREMETLGYWEARRDGLEQIEAVFIEPSDAGLGKALSRFWQGWQEVANAPLDAGVRAALVTTSEDLASTLQRGGQALRNHQLNVDEQIRGRMGQVADLAGRIAALNGEIRLVEQTGNQANDLRDQRDVHLTDLARLVHIAYTETGNGSISIFVGGRPLVEGDRSSPFQIVNDASGLAQVQWPGDGSAVAMGNGEVQGLLDLRDTLIPQRLTELDQLAATLISAVNALQAAGFDRSGNPGQTFFTGTGASDIGVASAVRADPSLVAAASAPNAPGDGSLALQIAQLQYAKVMSGGTATVTEFYQGVVSRLGAYTSQGLLVADNQQALVQHLTQRQEALAGVSLDEEATSLIRYQRAYEAAARMVTAVDELLDKLINGTGVVGR